MKDDDNSGAGTSRKGSLLISREVNIRNMANKYYGFIDETGSPGISTKYKRSKEYFGISLVLFASMDDIEKAERVIADTRKYIGLSRSHEFHASKDKAGTLEQFLHVLSKLDFQYIFVSIQKTQNKKDTSYKKLVHLFMDELKKRNIEFSKIKMDDNQTLYDELRSQAKKNGIILKCKQAHSKDYIGIQIADYIANVSVRDLATDFSNRDWNKLKKKQLN